MAMFWSNIDHFQINADFFFLNDHLKSFTSLPLVSIN